MRFTFTSGDIKRSNLPSRVQRHSLQSSVFSIPDKPEKELLRRSVSACSFVYIQQRQSPVRVVYMEHSWTQNFPTARVHRTSRIISAQWKSTYCTEHWSGPRLALVERPLRLNRREFSPCTFCSRTQKRLTGCRKALLMPPIKINNSCAVCLLFQSLCSYIVKYPSVNGNLDMVSLNT